MELLEAIENVIHITLFLISWNGEWNLLWFIKSDITSLYPCVSCNITTCRLFLRLWHSMAIFNRKIPCLNDCSYLSQYSFQFLLNPGWSVGGKHHLRTSTKLFTTQSRLLTTLKKEALKNTGEKGENAGNQHFLLFPQCFLLYQREKSSF